MISDIRQAVDFIADWHGIAKGFDNAVDARIPLPLRTVYTAFRNQIGETIRPGTGPLLSTNDHLTPYESLVLEGDTFEFCFENQGIWSCRCPIEVSDGPVISNAPAMWDAAATGYTEVCDSLDHFLTTFVLQETVLSSEYLYSCNPDAAAAFVKSECNDVWVDGEYIYREPTHSFYLYSETYLLMKYRGYHLASNQKAPASSLQSALGAKRVCAS